MPLKVVEIGGVKKLLRNGAALVTNVDCCCVVECEYTVVANLSYDVDPGISNLYGSIDGNAVVYYDNASYPGSSPYQMLWTDIGTGQGLTSPSPGLLSGTHNFRYWWANDNNATPDVPVITVTITAATGLICVNGTTLDPDNVLGPPSLDIDLEPYQAPGDGDQSAYAGGLEIEITCGACAADGPGMPEALAQIGLGNGLEFLAANPELLPFELG